jgi:DNA repair photolyase
VRGGLRAHLRFFHLVDPAITRKRTIDGQALKCPTRLRVQAVEPLGVELPMYDITTGTGDFISNGVVSHNCFARPTHEYLDMNAREDFDRKIVVKVNLPEVLRRELNRPSWKGEHVALGTNTDPYQWVEKRYRLTRGVWEAMRDFRNPCSVLTKSPLLLRDLDLFKEIAAVTSFTANLSIPTIDEKVWRQTEPHTPNPRARIEAVAELTRAGIQCGVLVAPLIPGVNDDPAQVQEIVEACAEAGATHIGGICLHLRGAVKDIWFEWLEAYRPDLIPRYEQMYARGAYAPKAERERIMNLVRDARPEPAVTEPPPDYRRPARRPAANGRPMATRLMRGGLAEARAARRDDEPADDGTPIQQSLF